MISTDEILLKIKRLRPAGQNKWVGCCPSHYDQHPSMSIAIENGKLLMYCHAGCSFESILAALGVKGKATAAPASIDDAPRDDWKLDVAPIMARWMDQTFDTQYRELSEALGVSVASLSRLLPAWAAKHNAWAFPMSDGMGGYCGVRLRAMDGKKWSIRGGHSGLFIPGFGGMDESGPLLIVEGPTDTAAALDLGYRAIGRPDCSGGGKQLAAWIRRNPRQSVVILANRDTPKTRPDGTKFYPGQQGAEMLANLICGQCRELKIIMPPRAKDARQWLNQGGTHGQVEAVIRATRPWYRKSSAKAG